jgi:hypothetical protein
MPDQPRIMGYLLILTLNAESVIQALTVSKTAFRRF